MLILAAGFASLAVAVASPAPPPTAPPPSPAPSPSAARRPAAAPTPRPRVPVTLEGVVRGPDGKPLARALVIARDEQPELTPRSPATARTTETGAFRLTMPPGQSFLLRVESAGLAPATLRHVRAGTPLAVVLSRGAFLEGNVRETGRGTPVANATVEARTEMRSPGTAPSEPDSGVARTTTDGKGHFRLDGLAPGLHTVTAFARNVGRAERRGAATGRPLDLNLVPGGTIAGTVTDPRDKPIEGAAVRAVKSIPTGGGTTLLARTDAHGTYAIPGVPAGTYRVVATHPDFAPAALDAVAVERDADVRADVVLPPPAFIRGRLVGVGEQPTRGSVAWRQMSGATPPIGMADPLTAEAGDDGLFRLRVGPGSHVVEASAPGLASRRIDVDVPSGKDGVDLGDVALEAGITIRGHVRDASGRPIERATVDTWLPDTDQPITAQTEADGAYTLAGLGPGLFSISASATGMGRAQRKAEGGAAGIDFVLQPGGTITGAVVDEAGKPIEVFRVSARTPVRMGALARGRSDSFGAPDGRFVLEDLGEGEYVVDVTAPDHALASVSGIKLAAGGTADVGTVRLSAGGTVKGVVVDAASAPISGASVLVSGPGHDASRNMPEVITDSGGAFEVHGVVPGPAQVRVAHPDYAPGTTSGVDVDPARGPAEVRIVLSQGGRIEGRVQSRDGVLPPGPVVTARSLGPSPVFGPGGPNMQPVAADGTFLIEHVTAGPVSVMLLSGQGGLYRGSKEVRTQVREGETTTVEMTLRHIAISGKVTRSGTPLVGARVEFTSANGGMMLMFGGDGDPHALPPNVGITREDGSYDLVLSEPGEAYVEIQSPDRRTQLPTPPVTVADAETFVADFNVATAFIEGVVVDRDTEQPLAGAWVAAQPASTKGPAAGGGSAEASAEGRFRVEVDPGDYRVTARADGYGGDALPVTVGDGGASGVRVALARGLSIKGRIVDSAGHGVGGLMVAVRTGDGPVTMASSGWGRTLSDGSFELSGLRDSPYSITSQADGGLFAMATGVSPGEQTVTLTLRPGGRVQVRVIGVDGAPVSSGAVFVTSVQGGTIVGGLSSGSVDASGQAELMVPAGTIELTYRTATLAGKTIVTVASGGTVAAEIRLKPLGR